MQYVIQDFDPEGTETCECVVTILPEQIGIDEDIDRSARAVVLEQTQGNFRIRLYTMDKDSPLIVTLPKEGGYEIDSSMIDGDHT